jgi:hypothetical protein
VEGLLQHGGRHDIGAIDQARHGSARSGYPAAHTAAARPAGTRRW